MSECRQYTYASGDLLERPNTYFYSTYHGRSFIQCWRESRKAILSRLPVPLRQTYSSRPYASDVIDAKALLHTLIVEMDTRGTEPLSAEMEYWLGRLLKKFEVTKRIYSVYEIEPPHKPVGDAGFSDTMLYVAFSVLMCGAYCRTKQLQFLNVFLKVQDTLCAMEASLVGEARAELAWLIEQETQLLGDLMHSKGVGA